MLNFGLLSGEQSALGGADHLRGSPDVQKCFCVAIACGKGDLQSDASIARRAPTMIPSIGFVQKVEIGYVASVVARAHSGARTGSLFGFIC